MKAPNVYTPEVLRHLTVSVQLEDGRWVAARPLPFYERHIFRRARIAWRVFTGRYDALRWEGQE